MFKRARPVPPDHLETGELRQQLIRGSFARCFVAVSLVGGEIPDRTRSTPSECVERRPLFCEEQRPMGERSSRGDRRLISERRSAAQRPPGTATAAPAALPRVYICRMRGGPYPHRNPNNEAPESAREFRVCPQRAVRRGLARAIPVACRLFRRNVRGDSARSSGCPGADTPPL